MDEQKIIESFHMMWDNYPEMVRLIRKDFTIVAGNKVYRDMGGPTGVTCRTGLPELHKGCLAMQALKTGEAQIKDNIIGEKNYRGYWLPVEGTDEYFIHYNDEVIEYVTKMNEIYG